MRCINEQIGSWHDESSNILVTQIESYICIYIRQSQKLKFYKFH